MRVVHLCTNFFPGTGGIETFVLSLARHSLRVGISAAVVCFNRAKGVPGVLRDRDVVEGISVRRIPFVDLKYYQPAVVPLSPLRQADVVHVHGIGALLDFAVIARPLHRRPVVLSTHGGIFHTTRLAAIKRIYFHRWHRMVQRGVDVTVACSASDAALFAPVARRMVLIENGVDLGACAASAAACRDRSLLICAGRLTAHKRVDNVIRTFAQLVRRGHDVRLEIAGADADGLWPQLLALAAREGVAGRVRYVGPLDDGAFRALLGRATVLLSASEYEGFGLTVVEAMAAGCVPVVNDIPPFRAIVEDGRGGAVVDFSLPDRAAARIESIIRGDAGAMSAAARARAEEFSWEKKILQWKELYATVAAGRATQTPATGG